jgi:hypothetical protein
MSGLQVIDVTNPASPVIVGSVDTPGEASGVAVAGTHAYVADYGSGLQVIDITDPASPKIVGSVDTPGEAFGVAVAETHAYVADDEPGLQVIDITDPASPKIVGSVVTWAWGGALGVAVLGTYAYVADRSGLRIAPRQCELTPIFLAHSSVRTRDAGVEVLWRTIAEWNVVGFNVLRTEAGGQSALAVNETLIPPSGRGHEYCVLDRSVRPGRTYSYRLEVVDFSGGKQEFPLGEITVPTGTMQLVTLSAARPNPFGAHTTIEFEIAGERSGVALRIYDASGRLIRDLVTADMERGPHHVVWDGRDERGRPMGAGTYFYVLETQSGRLSARLVRVE